MVKRIEVRPRTRRAPPGVAHPVSALARPHSIANITPAPEAEQPFEEGAHDVIDADLRHRMISETAYRHYAERGYADGYDLDDWLAAEAEVDHLLLNPPGA